MVINKKKKIFPCRRFVLRVSCFRLDPADETGKVYELTAGDRYLKIEVAEDQKKVRFYCTQEEFEQFWKTYFDLDTCYADYLSLIKDDEYLKRAARIWKRYPYFAAGLWEMIDNIYFIQQSNIPRIKSMIQRISEWYGDKKKPAKDMYIMHFREQSSLYRRPKKNFGRLSSVIEANIYAILRKWWQRELLILKK